MKRNLSKIATYPHLKPEIANDLRRERDHIRTQIAGLRGRLSKIDQILTTIPELDATAELA